MMQVLPQAMLPGQAMLPAGLFTNGRSLTQQELMLLQQQAMMQQQVLLQQQQAMLVRNGFTMAPFAAQMTPVAGVAPMTHMTLASPFGQLPCGQSAASASEPCTDSSDEGKDMSEASAELMAQLEAGGAACAGAIEALRGAVVDLAFDPSGCRIVQKALQVGGSSAVPLAEEMQGPFAEPAAHHMPAM